MIGSICLLALACSAPATAADYRVVLTTDVVKHSTSPAMSCNDKVYAFITAPQSSSGTHRLEGRWYRPDGKRQEDTKVPLNLKTPENAFQMWLKIERAGDAVDALFTQDDDDFDGEWTLVVYWDGKKVATKRFNLRCG